MSPDCSYFFLASKRYRLLILFSFLTPLLIMFLLYVRIFFIIKQNTKSRNQLTNQHLQADQTSFYAANSIDPTHFDSSTDCTPTVDSSLASHPITLVTNSTVQDRPSTSTSQQCTTIHKESGSLLLDRVRSRWSNVRRTRSLVLSRNKTYLRPSNGSWRNSSALSARSFDQNDNESTFDSQAKEKKQTKTSADHDCKLTRSNSDESSLNANQFESIKRESTGSESRLSLNVRRSSDQQTKTQQSIHSHFKPFNQSPIQTTASKKASVFGKRRWHESSFWSRICCRTTVRRKANTTVVLNSTFSNQSNGKSVKVQLEANIENNNNCRQTTNQNDVAALNCSMKSNDTSSVTSDVASLRQRLRRFSSRHSFHSMRRNDFSVNSSIRLKSSNSPTQNQLAAAVCGGGTSQSSSSASSHTKALYTTLIILGTYLVCWMPALCFLVLTCVDGCPFPLFTLSIRKRVILSFINNSLVIIKSMVDPFIYIYRMKEVKSALRRSGYWLYGNATAINGINTRTSSNRRTLDRAAITTANAAPNVNTATAAVANNLVGGAGHSASLVNTTISGCNESNDSDKAKSASALLSRLSSVISMSTSGRRLIATTQLQTNSNVKSKKKSSTLSLSTTNEAQDTAVRAVTSSSSSTSAWSPAKVIIIVDRQNSSTSIGSFA